MKTLMILKELASKTFPEPILGEEEINGITESSIILNFQELPIERQKQVLLKLHQMITDK